MVRLCTEEYEQRGFTVTVEAQNQFKLFLENGTISGKPDIVAWRDDEAVIADAKAAKPNPSHEIQVMLYMAWLPLSNPNLQKSSLAGEVYYGEEAVIDIPASKVDDRFKARLSNSPMGRPAGAGMNPPRRPPDRPTGPSAPQARG